MGHTIHGRKLRHPDVTLKTKLSKTTNQSIVNLLGSRDFDQDQASHMMESIS
jgi:hypothetical protein